MRNRSRTICYLFNGELTIRELIFGIGVLAVYVMLGFFIHGKIQTTVDNRNMKYANAYFTQDDAAFVQAYETEQGSDIFAYGDLETVDPITITDWIEKFNKTDNGLMTAVQPIRSQKYAKIYIEKEHHTRHTRRVAHTCTVNGKTHTTYTTEVYYTWDNVWSYSLHSSYTTFCSIKFPYGTIHFPNLDKIGYNRSGSDRWTIYGTSPKASGIAFLHIDDKNIGTDNTLYEYPNTVEACETLREDLYFGNWPLILFWVLFIAIGIGLVIAWAVLDNDWLNHL